MINYEYEHEQELEDGSLKNWILCYEVEPPSRGGRDEPPSGGVASIYEIRHEDKSVLPTDSWETAGFTKEKVRELEELCYESWADAPGKDDDGDRQYDERKDRQAEKECEDPGAEVGHDYP